MVSLQELVEIGFTQKEAEALLKDKYFKKEFGNWPKERLLLKINLIISIYGIKNSARVMEVIAKWPRFIGYNHEKAIYKAMQAYKTLNKQLIADAILAFPQFARLNHKKALDEAIKVYGAANKQRIINAILTFPEFAKSNHRKNMQMLLNIYGKKHKAKIIDAILTVPQFPEYDHKRALANVVEAGKKAGLTFDQCVDIVLSIPKKAKLSPEGSASVEEAFRKLLSKK